MQSKGGLLLDLESKTSNRKHGNTHALSECKTNERPICFVDRAESIWCQLFYTSGPPIETRKDGNISIVEIYREDLPRFRCRKRRPNSCSCFVWALWSYWGGKALFPLAFFGPKMPLARTQSPTTLTLGLIYLSRQTQVHRVHGSVRSLRGTPLAVQLPLSRGPQCG